MKKAQIGIEFMFIIGVVILLFIFMLGLAHDKGVQLIKVKDYSKKKVACSELLDKINAAFINGDNTIIDMQLGYDISANNKVIKVENIQCSSPVSIETLNATKGNIEIRNTNGLIFIENA